MRGAIHVQTQGPSVHRLWQRCPAPAAPSEVVACYHHGVRRLDPVGALALLPLTRWAKMSRSLHDALDETLGFIQRALDRIRDGEGAEAELHNVRAYLVNLLEL